MDEAIKSLVPPEVLEKVHAAKVIIKVTQYTATPNTANVRVDHFGDVALMLVEDVAPSTVTEGDQVISSRPERAPVVVQVIRADSSLNAATDERQIKRERIGKIAYEQVAAAGLR